MDRCIGLISDTHGLLRPQAIEALRGVDRIVHAGDVGDPAVLERLAKIAPVSAVRGNVDGGELARRLPRTAEIETPSGWLHVLHILEELELNPRAAGFVAVVFGHSHRPSLEQREGVLYVNPGSAGPRRFELPVTVARMVADGGAPRVEYIDLDV